MKVERLKDILKRITGIDVRREMHPFCLFSDQARIKDGVCAKKKRKRYIYVMRVI